MTASVTNWRAAATLARCGGNRAMTGSMGTLPWYPVPRDANRSMRPIGCSRRFTGDVRFDQTGGAVVAEGKNGILTEFKEFALEGNVLELAIAFILGLYFKQI
ncbi:MAG: MscL family protein, partial [Acidimicrobiia bacterium]